MTTLVGLTVLLFGYMIICTVYATIDVLVHYREAITKKKH